MTTLTTPTAVARAVARDAEQRARAALEGALTAHTQLLDADTAITTATQAKAAAGPALARAIDAARAAGISTDQLADLGITVPSARTRRRTSRTASPATSTATQMANPTAHPWPSDGPPGGHDPNAEVASSC